MRIRSCGHDNALADVFEDAPSHAPSHALNTLLMRVPGQRLVPGKEPPNEFRYFVDYVPLDPAVAKKMIGTMVMLENGASKQTAARSVRNARDSAYPLNPATLKVNGVTVYEGWTVDGSSHFLAWVEGSDNIEVSLDTASQPGFEMDPVLKRQGISVATALAGQVEH